MNGLRRLPAGRPQQTLYSSNAAGIRQTIPGNNLRIAARSRRKKPNFPDLQSTWQNCIRTVIIFMHMQISNIHFTRLIKIGDRLREFNFRKMPGSLVSYHIDVTDEKGKRLIFTLHKDEQGLWQTSQTLPLWLEACIPMLTGIVEEQGG